MGRAQQQLLACRQSPLFKTAWASGKGYTNTLVCYMYVIYVSRETEMESGSQVTGDSQGLFSWAGKYSQATITFSYLI